MVPLLDFHGQPFHEEDAAGAFLRRALADDSITSLSIAVAWARFGGVARLAASFEEFRSRNGTVQAILGIDEGVATRPGLRKAIATFDTVLIFHDSTGRTFHPKVYLAEGPSKALLLVGSSNATAGGLFFNYEASVEAEFRLPDEESEPALAKARAYFELLRADEDICVELTSQLIDELLDDPRYPIAETERRRQRETPVEPPEGAEQDELDSDIGDGGDALSPPIFGTSRHRKPGVPPLPVDARRELSEFEAEGDEPVDEAEVTHHAGPSEPAQDESLSDGPRVVASWSKTLSHTDAQQPALSGTNPTGHLKLSRAGRRDVDHVTWFRHELFGAATWTAAQDGHENPIDEATIPMQVKVGGIDVGTLELRVSHGEHRVADQGNVPTWLHWGTQLAQVLRETDYSGHTVTIERLDDDSYRLRIKP